MFKMNPIARTDGYKITHPQQYPPGTTELLTYIEARGGPTDGMIQFGAQMLAQKLAETTITEADVEEFAEFSEKYIGPGIFQKEAWMLVPREYDGKIPIEIRAAIEGMYIPNHNVIATARSTDPRLFWMTSFIETQFLRGIWYPTTVATNSNIIKKSIYKNLMETSDDPDGEINFKLHDFGARGVSSGESAEIGGAAHLANFMGSDTLEGVYAANYFYDIDMSAFSIPAAEHSTITTWGKDREVDAFRNMLNAFPGSPLIAVVSDSYDLWNAVDNLWGGELREEVIASGKVLVIRPDSGDPLTVVLQTIQKLDAKFGHKRNKKGYKVLNTVRIIQGDGVNIESIQAILDGLKAAGWSGTNIAFGMGGALLQHVTRDDYKYADKACYALVNGVWIEVFKDPITDPGKRSRSGNVDLIKFGHGLMTINRDAPDAAKYADAISELQVVYRNGLTYNRTNLTAIRGLVDHDLHQKIQAAA
jgi:nicotinamide phosphoribosyltransferase